MKTVAIVVVTYNRIECLKKWIQCYLELEKSVGYEYIPYIIDNCSTDGTDKYIQEELSQEIPKLKCFRLNENTGGAGGFSEGIKQVIENENDYLWGMDDDAYPHKDALSNLLSCYEKLKEFENNELCIASNSIKDMDFAQNGFKKVEEWMFVGFFVPLSILKEVGLPRKDFFIYRDDTEYAHRITKKYNIYRVKDSIIDHSVGGPSMLDGKDILGRHVRFYLLPNWKLYYFIRNELLMYKPSEIKYYKSIFHAIRTMYFLWFLNNKQVPIVRRALFHGIIRKSGIVMRP